MSDYRLKVYRRWFRKPVLVLEKRFRWPVGIPGIGGTVEWDPVQADELLRGGDLLKLLARSEEGK